MMWRARVRDVRRHDGGLRWTLIASTPDLETLVFVDTLESGAVFDIQSDEHVGTSGDEALDRLVCETVRKAITKRHVGQQLDDADRQRWGRVQRPADRRWAA